ncbi:hypothetical protein LNV23_19025 [Paucibacter sp. DJ1R-11]|uniref:hypothetical protein n=1 Tax=Paucibacter sp. DJ1R-11 TaxID=2893556 RepID=UPI0021E4543B|nr:hypothetical protein [Paucibacter sp. DJ1R-11]MCV2365547.1 hypothetical protein [Paucibacter sp. DJ1R-11]
MSTTQAIRHFKENLELIPKDLTGEPLDQEAWNLNQGLLALAKSLAQVQSELRDLKNDIRRLR